MGRGALARAPIQELYDPAFESVANLDDLQRSWETLKNVVRATTRRPCGSFVESHVSFFFFELSVGRLPTDQREAAVSVRSS